MLKMHSIEEYMFCFKLHPLLIIFLFFNCRFFSPQVMIWAHLQQRLQTSLRGCLSSQGKICIYESKDENLNITNL